MVTKEELFTLAFEGLEMNIEPAIAELGVNAEPCEILECAQAQLKSESGIEWELIDSVVNNKQSELISMIENEASRWATTSY